MKKNLSMFCVRVDADTIVSRLTAEILNAHHEGEIYFETTDEIVDEINAAKKERAA